MSLILRAMVASALLLLAACGPSIGLKKDFQTQGFEVGRTTRQDMIARLGLPQKIVKDSDGREHLIYEGTARLVGLCIGCGVTSTSPGVIPSLMSESAVKNSSAEYVFDELGILAAKFEPTKKRR